MTTDYFARTSSLASSGFQGQLTLSQDGHVRLRFDVLKKVNLIHLISGFDLDGNTPLEASGARLSPICGFTEWISDTRPALTLGWDWEFAAREGRLQCTRLDDPRSNIMLYDAQREDLGMLQTARLLGELVDDLDWQDPVMAMIREHSG